MEYANIILKSNVIFTGCDAETISGGVIIEGNRIVAVVPEAEIPNYIKASTRMYEYKDKLIMPGLIDAHDHLWWGAVADSVHMVDVTRSTSEQECIEMIKKYAVEHSDEKRIRGFGWYPANWNDAPLPTKISLDEAVSDRPAYMMCADAHTCWMNSLALEESGYTPNMILDGGSVGTFCNGEMNGIVYEPDALIYAWENIYDFPDEQIKDIVKHFMKGLAKCGVTSLSEMSADDYSHKIYDRYRVFNEMADEGDFTSRVHVFTKLMGYTDFTIAKRWASEFCSDTFRVMGLKGFLDGVTSTYTAALIDPYEDRPDTCGIGVPLTSQRSLEKSIVAGNKAGLPVRIHCIGDKAVRMALDAFAVSKKINGNYGFRNTIEHIETISSVDIPRFKELGVIASMQGEHLSLDANEKIIRMGKSRSRWEWPFKSILDSGAILALGTDFPIVKYNQFPGIYAAITRKNYDGSPAGIENGENLTVAEALSANTLGSAKVYGREDELGTLEKGKLADVIVLDRNLFKVDHEEIKDTSVILTIMNGKVTHEG